MEVKGNVLLNSEFKHTVFWPNPQPSINGPIDLETEYKKALAGKMCLVMDIGVDGSYLVLGESEKVGPFIWMIEKEDAAGFLPIVKKNGVMMPAGLSPIEEFKWIAKHFSKQQQRRAGGTGRRSILVHGIGSDRAGRSQVV